MSLIITKLHKEVMKRQQTLDSKKWGLNFAEVDKYPHPLKDNLPHLCNNVSGQVVTTVVIVADSFFNWEKMGIVLMVSLPDGF